MEKNNINQEIIDRLEDAEDLIKEILLNISSGYNPILYLKIKQFLEDKECIKEK